MTERPDFDRMTPEEVDAWSDAELERNLREHANDPPLLEYNRAKWQTPPQFEFAGFVFNLRAGFLIICDTPLGRRRAENVGLVPVAEGGSLALVVALGSQRRERWALRRADGEVWASDVADWYASVPARWVPVLAWPLPARGAAGSVPGPAGVESWTVFTPARYVPEDAEWFDDRPKRRR